MRKEVFNRPSRDYEMATTQFMHQCSLCGSNRSNGNLLPSRTGIVTVGLWVCVDCQHKLSRRVDDEGALGG